MSQGRSGLALTVLLLALALSGGSFRAAGETTSQVMGVQLFSPSMACHADGAQVTFTWQPSAAGHQWVDLSLFNNDFSEGSFLGAGPVAPHEGSLTWSGIQLGLRHFWRVTSLEGNSWSVSATGSFVPCPAASAIAQPLPPAAPLAVSLGALEQELFDSQNEQRMRAGLSPLRLDGALVLAARRRAQDMAAKNYFDHYSPSGENAFTLLDAGRIRYSLAAENIARNNHPEGRSAAVALSGFMGSAGHRENILERTFLNVGVGAAVDGDMKYFAVIFVRP